MWILLLLWGVLSFRQLLSVLADDHFQLLFNHIFVEILGAARVKWPLARSGGTGVLVLVLFLMIMLMWFASICLILFDLLQDLLLLLELLLGAVGYG